MAYDLTSFSASMREIEEWLKKELTLVRTGRATAAVLDNIHVESYGAMSPIAHVGTVSMEDHRTLRVIPWDKSVSKAIDAAIQKANLGLSVSVDDQGLRIVFPELTSERRAQMIKILNGKLEDARISVRKERERVLGELKQGEKDGDISEDEHFKAKEALQKLVEDANNRLESVAAKKEEELKG